MHIQTRSSSEVFCERLCGQLMFVIVNVLLAYVFVVEFFIIVPFERYHKNSYFLAFLVVFGFYLFVNIWYHYYKSCFTSPGFAPKVEGATICSECRYYKPSIAHHCRSCNRCVLRMDHHCVFIGQCVGLYNHRHFFQFVMFLGLGSFTACFSGLNTIWYNVIILHDKSQAFCSVVSNSYFLKTPVCLDGVGGIVLLLVMSVQAICWSGMILGVMFTIWNAILISADMTHVDSTKENSWSVMFKSMKNFENVKKNWINFLGLQTKRRSFLRHILLPSSHVAMTYDHGIDQTLLSVRVH